MYRFGHRQVHHYFLYGLAGGLTVLILGLVIAAARNYFQPHTVLKQSRPITHMVSSGQTATKLVNKGIFAVQLPVSWRAGAPPRVQYTVYSWTGTGTYDSARRLDVYVDASLPSLAFNRLLPVQAAGDQLEITGTVSDNCTSFTDKTAAFEATGYAPSKWGGVSFLCDMGNYERDVTAIGSTEGLNRVGLRGATAGSHRVLLVYTDNNATPDYTIFLGIVKSFRLL